MKELNGAIERKLNDTWRDSNRPGRIRVWAALLGYIFGYQSSICGDFMPYKKRRKLSLYFGSKPPAKIYSPLHLLLKNKNTFAMMVSSMESFHPFSRS